MEEKRLKSELEGCSGDISHEAPFSVTFRFFLLFLNTQKTLCIGNILFDQDIFGISLAPKNQDAKKSTIVYYASILEFGISKNFREITEVEIDRK
jgi:hypothetical protein